MKPTIMSNHKLSTVRVSVYDVYYWQIHGCSDEENMQENNITREELQAALDFIAANRELVHQGHLAIEERNARGNSPEVLAKIEAARPFLEEKKRRIREALALKETVHDQSHSGGSQLRGPCRDDAESHLAQSGVDAILE